MSKLEDITFKGQIINVNPDTAMATIQISPKCKQQIKDLFLELIGKFEQEIHNDIAVYDAQAAVRNDLREELRKKTKEL